MEYCVGAHFPSRSSKDRNCGIANYNFWPLKMELFRSCARKAKGIECCDKFGKYECIIWYWDAFDVRIIVIQIYWIVEQSIMIWLRCQLPLIPFQQIQKYIRTVLCSKPWMCIFISGKLRDKQVWGILWSVNCWVGLNYIENCISVVRKSELWYEGQCILDC